MKVYILIYGNYDDVEILGIYSNRESAYTALRTEVENNPYIREADLDIWEEEVQD